jgi:hypothetical protein
MIPRSKPRIAIRSKPMYGLMPLFMNNTKVPNIPNAIIGPCERLMTFMTPQINVNPIAAKPYTNPTRIPSGRESKSKFNCCILSPGKLV